MDLVGISRDSLHLALFSLKNTIHLHFWCVHILLILYRCQLAGVAVRGEGRGDETVLCIMTPRCFIFLVPTYLPTYDSMSSEGGWGISY